VADFRLIWGISHLWPCTAGVDVAQLHGMLEDYLRGGSDTDATFFLLQDGVTKIAVFLHDLAFGAHMLAIVATETAIEIEVSDAVSVSPPVQLHLRESGPLIDLLHFRDCGVSLALLICGDVRCSNRNCF
jgi:hypothetical protein